MSERGPRRRLLDLLGLGVLVGVLVGVLLGSLTIGSPAWAATDPVPTPASQPVPAPTAGRPWFGPGLDWTEDLPRAYAGRLGSTPALYGQRVHYPLTDDDTTYLEQFAQQAATQGAVAALTLEPQVALTDLTAADARELARTLARLHVELDSYFLVRFAPEMNGSWVPWGQQPTSYVAAFRTVASAVHAATDQAAMVWAPSYGADYPFSRAYGDVTPSAPRELAALDTDGDGTVDDGDDPYGPYYPGDASVDWVGLSLYFYGEPEDFGRNALPSPGEYAARLDESWGYTDDTGRESFYDRFAKPDGRPMLVETSALHNPAYDGGSSRLDLARDWWRQVFAADSDHPLIGAISWLELSRSEAEVDGRVVDWGATDTPSMASALDRDLSGTGAGSSPGTAPDIGPVTRVIDQQVANAATAQGRLPAADQLSAEMGWLVLCAALLAAAFVFAGIAGRWIPSWRYPDEHDPRDRRVDLFRGMIILTVVFTHVEVTSPYSYVSLNAIGAITGAEMFVMLSGVVLGMIYAPTLRRLGEWPTAVTMWRRARKQYVVSLVVVVLVFVIGRIPFVDASDITTFTDRGTGENGTAVAGQVYDLYANAPRLFDYPPPWYAVKQLLLLEMGPWVFNIMGLFVVLSLLLPAMMFLVERGLWWVLLALSWAAYVYQALSEPHWLPSQFEAVFPLLTWQVAFTHGLVLGHYRARVTRALTTRTGKAVCAVLVLGYAGSLVYLWAGHRFGFTVAPFPADSYSWLYAHFYTRVFLQPGRLIDIALMIVVTFAVLTTCWKPLNAAVGWLWIPLGQASLYVFIVHVFLTLAVGNIPGLDRGSWWQGTLIHTAVALVIWVMVKRRFLFSVIPR